MAPTVVDRAVLDTNVLVAATDEGRPEHRSAVEAITRWPAEGVVLYTSGQITREYLTVATRSVERNGLGLARSAAVANVRALRARLRLLTEDAKVADRLLRLLDEVDCTGKQVHDANIVATMLVHGLETVVTMNIGDFTRFGHHVRAVPLQP